MSKSKQKNIKRVTISGKNLEAFKDLVSIYMDNCHEDDSDYDADKFAEKMSEKLGIE